jgi:single-strand DNA-binding protein
MKDNAITIVGNLGGDPELRFTSSGKPVATLNVGVRESRLNRTNDTWEETGISWFRVTAWNQLAENIAESLTRGNRVIVVGKMVQTSFETKEGEKRYSWEIVADHVGPSLQYGSVSIKRADRARGDSDRADQGAAV